MRPLVHFPNFVANIGHVFYSNFGAIHKNVIFMIADVIMIVFFILT